MCKIASVSKSWYYKYKERLKSWDTKENREKDDLNLIKEIFNKSNQKKWWRRIQMDLLNKYWVIMNHKKIKRLMNKYNLKTKIRKKNPYRNIMKADQEHRTFDNILNRKFNQKESMKSLCTDITYLHYHNWARRAYLSTIKDSSTKEILSWKLSSNMEMDFVLKTIDGIDKKLIKKNKTVIHSDQWLHYTNLQYINKLKKLWVIQSMSRRWNCLDNAPIESFFWHMKDEIDYKKCKNFKELENLINNYMNYYNNERYQWWIKKMTPVQYRNHLNSKA